MQNHTLSNNETRHHEVFEMEMIFSFVSFVETFLISKLAFAFDKSMLYCLIYNVVFCDALSHSAPPM